MAAIREAIDKGLPSSDRRRARAAALVLGAEPMAVPDVEQLVAELDELRGRRG